MIDFCLGDCLDVFRGVRGLRSIVADLPAGISFMGRKWDRPPKGTGHRGSRPVRDRSHERRLQDRDAFVGYWAERLGVAHDACADDAVALIWALPRTSGWTATALEDAGWRVVDRVSHIFGQGWPKTPRVLKPAVEDWWVAVKGAGLLDVEACRVERGERPVMGNVESTSVSLFGHVGRGQVGTTTDGSRAANAVLSHCPGCEARGARRVKAAGPAPGDAPSATTAGVYGKAAKRSQVVHRDDDGTESVPAYDCLAGCDCGASWLAPSGGEAPRCGCGRPGWWACPVAEVDAQSGDSPSGSRAEGVRKGLGYGSGAAGDGGPAIEASAGGASRFFNRIGYYGKCPSGERHAGAEHLLWTPDKTSAFGYRRVTREEWEALPVEERAEGNTHATVKRLALMRWLHALAGGGPIGDLSAGSGSGAIAAHLDGHDWIGAEVCPEAIEIAEARLAWWRGLSPSAVAEFTATDVVPKAPAADPRQVSLF